MLKETCGVNGIYADDFIELPEHRQEQLLTEWYNLGIHVVGTIGSHKLFKGYYWEFLYKEAL